MPVCILDDDPSVCRSVSRVLRSADLQVCAFTSPSAFLQWSAAEEVDCLVLDVGLPERSGLDVQRDLVERGIPIVFITGQSDVPSAVQAMRAGAIDFLSKPFGPDALLSAVSRGLEAGRHRSREALLRRAFETLTPREREVFHGVVRGRLNKQIGYDLCIAVKTVKVHRRRVFDKMMARSLPELVRMADRLGSNKSASARTEPQARDRTASSMSSSNREALKGL